MKMSSWQLFTFCWDNMYIVLVIFFLLGGFCQESKESIKELKSVFHSAVWTQFNLGIYKLWFGSSVLHIGFSIEHEHVSYFTWVSCSSRTPQNTWSMSFRIPLNLTYASEFEHEHVSYFAWVSCSSRTLRNTACCPAVLRGSVYHLDKSRSWWHDIFGCESYLLGPNFRIHSV